MSRLARAGALLCSVWGLAAMADDAVVVRQQLNPEGSVTVGQCAVLSVDVLAKDAWAKLATLPQVEVGGAIVFEPPSQSTRLNESIRGDSYTGQRYEWWIYPQQTGQIRVPAIKLNVSQTVFGSAPSPEPVLEVTQPLSIEVRLPSKEATGISVVTPDLEAKQSWSGESKQWRVGDGVIRTIERDIDDAPALILPPIDFVAPPGVQLFVKQPLTNNRFNRGSLSGSRTDAVTYVFESAGTIDLPAIEIRWWDSETSRVRKEMLEGITAEVLPALDRAIEQKPQESPSLTRRSVSWLVGGGLTSLILLVLIWHFAGRLGAWIRRVRRDLAESESMNFHRFQRAARGTDSRAILRALTAWSDQVQKESETPQVTTLFRRFGEETGLQELDRLTRCIDANVSFDASKLVRHVRELRKRLRRTQRLEESTKRADRGATLPPLHS
ncbi:MAG: hypothetical protein AAGD07_05835 [Planctomycetota bacterium]